MMKMQSIWCIICTLTIVPQLKGQDNQFVENMEYFVAQDDKQGTDMQINLLENGIIKGSKHFIKSMSVNEDSKGEMSLDDLRSAFDSVTEEMQNVNNGTCVNDTFDMLVSAFLKRSTWALEMIDAFGKPRTAILRGSIQWLGSYDECLAVDPPQTEVTFSAQYCLDKMQSQSPKSKIPYIMIGTCIPDTCSEAEIQSLIQGVLKLRNISMSVTVSCQKGDPPLDTKAKVALVICSVFGFFILLGTGVDVVLMKMKTKKESSLTGTYGTLKESESTNHVSEPEVTPLLKDIDRDLGLEMGKEKPEQDTQGYDKHGIGIRLLLSFSVYTNGAKILNTRQATGSLTAVHGIRFFSMTWVVLGHTFAMVTTCGSNILPYTTEVIARWTFQVIYNATVSVDSFFTLSGLLVTYLTLKELQKRKGKLNWFMFYFHRFWRLTPAYMMVLMIFVCLFRFMGNGPVWPRDGREVPQCEKYWWTNLLYINNLVNKYQQCFAWAWYLANDMQFYVISPLIIIPLYYSKVIGLAVAGVFLTATVTTAGVISRVYDLPAGGVYPTTGGMNVKNYQEYYVTPYCRMGPYIVGMLAGYILYKTQCRIRMSKVVCILGWMVASCCALACLYSPYKASFDTPLPRGVAAFYNATFRSIWSVAVSWVIVACVTGHGGFVNTFLSWGGFVPLSRLTYCVYLVHLMVVGFPYFTTRDLFYANDVNLIYNYVGTLGLSYAVAFLTSLAFEAPMVGLERVVFKRERKA